MRDFAGDPELLAELTQIKRENKQHLAAHVKKRQGVELSSDAMFIVQVKRMHEYKRQLLNCLYLISEYQRCGALLQEPGPQEPGLHQPGLPSRVFVFAGKAAPGYVRAKLIIKLINEVAAVVNADRRVQHELRAILLPNYDVPLAELILPAADLSVQISLAGTEASGTGNMTARATTLPATSPAAPGCAPPSS